jgi:exodeoxyribonuclease-5
LVRALARRPDRICIQREELPAHAGRRYGTVAPCKFSHQPALDSKVLENYNLKVNSAILSDVVRQAENSGILYNATAIRMCIKNNFSNSFFNIKKDGINDIKLVSGEELIETISDCYDKYGIDETIIVTRSNKRANKFNQGIRQMILWRESELETGDMLMIVKNNYFYSRPDENFDFIANGDIARVEKVIRTEEIYGFRYATVRLSFSIITIWNSNARYFSIR